MISLLLLKLSIRSLIKIKLFVEFSVEIDKLIRSFSKVLIKLFVNHWKLLVSRELEVKKRDAYL